MPELARLMQIYSAFEIFNDTLQFNDYSFLSLKGFQMGIKNLPCVAISEIQMA